MAYLLPHLNNGWEVDQAIVTEEDRVVVIRFGKDNDPTCMVQDEVLASIAEKVKNFAVIYVVDIEEVPDFNNMYEIVDPCTTMFFVRTGTLGESQTFPSPRSHSNTQLTPVPLPTYIHYIPVSKQTHDGGSWYGR